MVYVFSLHVLQNAVICYLYFCCIFHVFQDFLLYVLQVSEVFIPIVPVIFLSVSVSICCRFDVQLQEITLT